MTLLACSSLCYRHAMKLGVKYAIIVLVVYGSCLMVYINYKATSSLPLSSTDSDVDVHANSARQLQQSTNQGIQLISSDDSGGFLGFLRRTFIGQTSTRRTKWGLDMRPARAPEAGVTRIIVAAYYRSGSTFVSDLLALTENSFNLCEPFYAIYANWYGTVGYHEVLYKGDGYRRALPQDEAGKMETMMDDMLACDFSQLPHEFYISRFHWEYPTTPNKKSPYMDCLAAANITQWSHRSCFRGFPQICSQRIFVGGNMANLCYNSKHGLPGSTAHVRRYLARYSDCVNRLWARMSHCAPLLQAECKRSRTRVIKTIRLDLDTVDRIVRHNPDVRVVHLVRDPRAMFNSRKKWIQLSRYEITSTCERMRGDLASLKRLLDEKPVSNYFLARYEDIIADPMTSAMRVYSHVRLETPPHFTQWLANHTQASKDNAPEGTVRSNSTAHISAWKSTKGLAELFVRYAPRSCYEVLEALHYDT